MITLGVLRLGFIGLPRDLEQAREFVLHFLGLVSEWRIFRPMVVGFYKLAAVAHDVVIHNWLHDGGYYSF